MQIGKNTLPFLEALAKNNNKEWFDKNKSVFKACHEEFTGFCKEVQLKLAQSDQLEGMKVFRMNRDIRFSKDKTPYKNNFGASFQRIKPYLRGGYYLHIEPGNSFAGGGFWSPVPEDLKRIRQEIAADPMPLQKIASAPDFKKYFDEFKGEQLTSMPRGFSASLPGQDLIRRKQYLVMRSFSDKEIQNEKFSEEVIKTFKAMRPFFDYMTLVLTTDSNGESLFR